MTASGIKTVYGGGSFGLGAFTTVDECHQVFDILKAHGVQAIDTAQMYGPSEQLLGEAKAGERFILDTKTPGGFSKETADKDYIIKSGHESIKKLGVPNVDIFYLHAPTDDEPRADLLFAINEVYKAGLFRRFGVSNFAPKDVQAVYDHCEQHGYVKPSVYQGNYNPVARRQDTELLPTLRKLGIAFYAYSPLAGGFLSKSKQEVLDGKGRFGKDFVGPMYTAMYAKPELLDGLSQWQSIADEAGVPRAELAYRWVKYNSALKPEYDDAIIVGSSTIDQLKQTLDGLDHGPLPANIVAKIDGFWETIKHVAPLDNVEGFKASQKK